MKSRRIGTSIFILCIVTVSQTQCYGKSTFPQSNSSHCNTKNSTTLRESHNEGINNAEKVLHSLGGKIRADHYARKAAFLEKELEICLTEMGKCNLTTAELRDHLMSTNSTARTSDPRSAGSSGTQEVGQGKLRLTTATNESLGECKDQNVNQTEPTTELSEKAILLRKKQAEFLSMGENFLGHHNYRGWMASPWIELLMHTVRARVIFSCEYSLYIPQRKIPYEDALVEMTKQFTEEETVYIDFLLAEMAHQKLITQNRKKANLPLPIEELKKFIPPKTVLWIFHFLVSDYSEWMKKLKRMVGNEPNLSLFEFCWCISRIHDDANPAVFKNWYTEDQVNGNLGMGCSWIRQVIEEFIERKNNEYGSAEPLLRTIKLLLMKCEELEDTEIGVLCAMKADPILRIGRQKQSKRIQDKIR